MEDAELVARVREGDDAALAELVSRHLPAANRLAVRLMTDQDRAEDIVQESFVKAWKNLRKFDASKAFAPWLLAIVRNSALDTLRKKRALPFSFLSGGEDDDFSIADTIADEEPLPDEVFARAETGQMVARALAELPERDRAVLSLRYEEEMSFEQIGTIMKAPMNTVKSWHRRAQERLRAIIEKTAPRHD